MKDFTPHREVIEFKLYDQVFTGVEDIPVRTAMNFATLGERMKEESDSAERMQIVEAMFEMVLVPESAERFIRLFDDKQHPVGVSVMFEIISWLMEQYGMGPTKLSGASFDGSLIHESGTSSQEATPVTELTSSPSA